MADFKTVEKNLTDRGFAVKTFATKEEAAAYFAGQKTAQEVCKLIQSKVNIYINEQK